MANFSLTVEPKKDVFCEIVWESGRLSICGAIYKGKGRRDKDIECFRQSLSHIIEIPRPFGHGWDAEMFVTFAEIWDQWHLNDVRAGSPLQERLLKVLTLSQKTSGIVGATGYDVTKQILEANNLWEDSTYLYKGAPYEWGSAWLKTDVPESVLEFLKNLPAVTKERR